MHRAIFDDVLRSVADVFRTLAHPDRIRLLGLLQQGERDVTQLHRTMRVSQSVTSQHLKLLKMHGVVSERREGRHVYYRLSNPQVVELISAALDLKFRELDGESSRVQLVQEMKALWHVDETDNRDA